MASARKFIFRSLDWKSRRAELICQLPAEVVQDVAAKIIALVAED